MNKKSTPTHAAPSTVLSFDAVISISKASHWAPLSNGSLRHFPTSCTHSAWRFCALKASENLMWVGIFESKPSSQQVEQVTAEWLDDASISGGSFSCPIPTLKAYPGLVSQLGSRGMVYEPAPSGQALAVLSKRWDGFLDLINHSLRDVSEEMASVSEMLASFPGNRQLVKIQANVDPERTEHEDLICRFGEMDQCESIVHHICQMRGRDPEQGRRRRLSSPMLSPLNRIHKAVAASDGVEESLRQYEGRADLTPHEETVLASSRLFNESRQDLSTIKTSDLGDAIGPVLVREALSNFWHEKRTYCAGFMMGLHRAFGLESPEMRAINIGVRDYLYTRPICIRRGFHQWMRIVAIRYRTAVRADNVATYAGNAHPHALNTLRHLASKLPANATLHLSQRPAWVYSDDGCELSEAFRMFEEALHMALYGRGLSHSYWIEPECAQPFLSSGGKHRIAYIYGIALAHDPEHLTFLEDEKLVHAAAIECLDRSAHALEPEVSLTYEPPPSSTF